MGWLSDIAGIGALIAAPFTGGTSLGVALPLLIGSAGANVLGAGIASDASQNAAKTQAAAGQQAINTIQQGQANAMGAVNQHYGQAESLFNPYVQMGQNALPGLARLAGSGYNPASLPQIPAGLASMAGSNYGGPGGGGMMAPSPYQMPTQAQPQGPQMPQGAPMGLSGMSASPQGAAPPLVTMRAPNGQTSQVPANQVAHYQQMGAKVMS